MIYRALKHEMRQAAAATRGRGSPAPDEPTSDEHGDLIEPWMAVAFHDLANAGGDGDPFALTACVMNGKPSAVVMLSRLGVVAGNASQPPQKPASILDQF